VAKGVAGRAHVQAAWCICGWRDGWADGAYGGRERRCIGIISALRVAAT